MNTYAFSKLPEALNARPSQLPVSLTNSALLSRTWDSGDGPTEAALLTSAGIAEARTGWCGKCKNLSCLST